MLTSKYIVTGKERSSRFYLKPDTLATGFVESAQRFYERSKAQAAADRENALGVWGFQWSVTQQLFDAVTGKAV